MEKFDIAMTANCTVCNQEINLAQDTYFALLDIVLGSHSKTNWICANCAETVTPMDLYLSGKITMANSPDNTIEADGKIIDENVDMSAEQVNAFFESDDPVFKNNQECPLSPCEKCRYYYSETGTCMVGEKDIALPTQDEIDKVRNALGDDAVEKFFAVS